MSRLLQGKFFDIDLYETPFRRYDATTGRFTGVDAMAEVTMHLTPYQFGMNSPVMYNDPTGLLAAGTPKYTQMILDLYGSEPGYMSNNGGDRHIKSLQRFYDNFYAEILKEMTGNSSGDAGAGSGGNNGDSKLEVLFSVQGEAARA